VKSPKVFTSPDPLQVQETSNRKNSIYFFGGFQVIDRTGADITSKFTPLLKQLFLIINLHSIKNEKGISPARIIELLWFNKSDRNAKNNLSVNIAKLKNVLENLDKCELTHETGYWKIHQGKEIHNEYCDVESIVNSKKNINAEMIKRLIELTNKGSFLVNLDMEWLDVFKARISDRITDVLLSFAKSLDVIENAEQIIDVADCLFNFDVVNEEIMILKCKAQYGQGKHSLAKNTYEIFCSEYRTLYGEDYLRSFNTIINSEPEA
jgi:DNA-binding SARP family transcriptional activator